MHKIASNLSHLSAGGSYTLFEIAKQLSTTSATAISSHGNQVPAPSAIIFDSSPARITFDSAHRSFSASVGNILLRYIATTLVSVSYMVLCLYRAVTGKPDPVELVLKALNNPNFMAANENAWNWTSTCRPRAYIYSTGDKIVSAGQIEAHAAHARSKGYEHVRLENFGIQSGHVAHMRSDPERYWKVIRETWNEALTSSRTVSR